MIEQLLLFIHSLAKVRHYLTFSDMHCYVTKLYMHTKWLMLLALIFLYFQALDTQYVLWHISWLFITILWLGGVFTIWYRPLPQICRGHRAITPGIQTIAGSFPGMKIIVQLLYTTTRPPFPPQQNSLSKYSEACICLA